MDWIRYDWVTELKWIQFSSVTSVVSNCLQPHGQQHARPPCPSPPPRVYSNSCPSSRWCHPTISSSVVPFSSCLQSFPASGSFQMSQVFASGGQSIGVSASTSVLPSSVKLRTLLRRSSGDQKSGWIHLGSLPWEWHQSKSEVGLQPRGLGKESSAKLIPVVVRVQFFTVIDLRFLFPGCQLGAALWS